MTGVAVRIVLEVVLMLRFGLPEIARGCNFGDDATGPKTRRLDVCDGVLGDATLLVVQVVDRRAIARPAVVALTI